MRWFQYSIADFEETLNPENGGFVVMERKEKLHTVRSTLMIYVHVSCRAVLSAFAFLRVAGLGLNKYLNISYFLFLASRWHPVLCCPVWYSVNGVAWSGVAWCG